MKRYIAVLVGILLASLITTEAFAACPVGKKLGDVYCRDGYWWKCERCASVDCEILQAGMGRCLKDDEPFEVTVLSRLMQAATATPHAIPNFTKRPQSNN